MGLLNILKVFNSFNPGSGFARLRPDQPEYKRFKLVWETFIGTFSMPLMKTKLFSTEYSKNISLPELEYIITSLSSEPNCITKINEFLAECCSDQKVKVIEEEHSPSLRRLVKLLKEADLLSEKEMVLSCADTGRKVFFCGSVYKRLHDAGCLTKEILLRTPKSIDALLELDKVTQLLHDLGSLNEVSLVQIDTCAKVTETLNLFLHVFDYETELKKKFLALLQKHNYASNIFTILYFLNNSDVLRILDKKSLSRNHKILDSLLDIDPGNIIFSNDIRESIWKEPDSFLFTEVMVRGVIKICTTPSFKPETLLKGYIDRQRKTQYNCFVLSTNTDGNFSYAQNTHLLRVHTSVSESAIALHERYGNQNPNQALTTIKKQLTKSDCDRKTMAARRCFEDLLQQDSFIDLTSGVRLSELLGYIALAILDTDTIACASEVAFEQLRQGLYETQRGYNLDDQGIDDERDEDQPICRLGAFNKLISVLNGIHPDVTLEFVSFYQASVKLPVVVRQEVTDYLKKLSDSLQTIEKLLKFNNLIEKLESEGVTAIWNHIRGSVYAKMVEEFKELHTQAKMFQRQDLFKNLVEAGQYTDLGELHLRDTFKEQLPESKAYAQFMSEHRHDNPESQQKYDQQYGLVKYNPQRINLTLFKPLTARDRELMASNLCLQLR